MSIHKNLPGSQPVLDLFARIPWVDAKYFVGWRQVERGPVPRKTWA